MALAMVGASAGVTTVSADSPRPDRSVFGFFSYRDSAYMLSEADYSTLSTVAFASIPANGDGTLHVAEGGVPTPAWTAWNAAWMDQVIEKAHAAGARVALTVSRFAWTPDDRATTIAMLSNMDVRNALAAAIASAVTDRGVDGVNIDFEPIPFAVKWEFVAFIREVRAQLDLRAPGLELTFDATAKPGNYAIRELTAPGAADAVFVMAYPFRDSGATTSGATAPLGGRKYDVRATVDRYLSLTTPDKVILGLPYYSYEWSTETRYRNSRTRPAGPTYGYPKTEKISAAWALADKHGWRWSTAENVAWTRWRYRACPSCPRTWRQVYFESRRSLGLKYDLVNSSDLLGVGFWKIGNDAGHPELYELLRTKFGA